MDKSQTRILVAFWLLAAVLIVLVVFLVTRDSDASSATTLPETTVPTETTTVTAPTQTTAVTAPTETTAVTSPPDTTTSVPSEETTTSAPDGTTTPSTNTTLTTAPPGTGTTLTTSPPSGDLVLEDDGIGGVDFGATPAETIAFATSALGLPSNDTGWVDSFSVYGTCPRPEVRGVEWGSSDTGFGFVILFTKAGTSYQATGVEHFFGYFYVNGRDPAGLATPQGITIGSAVGDAEAAYPDFEIDENPFDPQGGAWSVDRDPSADTLLWGFSDGVDTNDLITTVNGGITCGE